MIFISSLSTVSHTYTYEINDIPMSIIESAFAEKNNNSTKHTFLWYGKKERLNSHLTYLNENGKSIFYAFLLMLCMFCMFSVLFCVHSFTLGRCHTQIFEKVFIFQIVQLIFFLSLSLTRAIFFFRMSINICVKYAK